MTFSDFVGTDRKEELMNELHEGATQPGYTNELVGTGHERSNTAAGLLLRIAGTLFLIIGCVGIVLPLLPTTPFLLLALGCYARSSERWYRRLITNRWCGEYIKNWHEGKVILIIIAICVSMHVLFLPTLVPGAG
jgi:uncharacterized membrane protein YbaN (DUF454 family)